MACHQHRCCRRPTSTELASTVDYILLAPADANAIDVLTSLLRDAGMPIERHDLGLRFSPRGSDFQAVLAKLCDMLAPRARRSIRVAMIPIGVDAVGFQQALLASQPLDAFQQRLAAASVGTCAAPTGNRLLGDVFKGESLE